MNRHPLNQAVMEQVFTDLRHGQLRRIFELGINEKDIELFKNDKMRTILLNSPARWVQANIDVKILYRLQERLYETEQEISIIDQMLNLGASSKMITDLFGLDQREVALRKRVLKIDKKQGRWQEITDEQSHELWRLWKAKISEHQLDPKNMMDMAKLCMIFANDKNIPMAMIWQAIEKWIEIDEGS